MTRIMPKSLLLGALMTVSILCGYVLTSYQIPLLTFILLLMWWTK